VFVVGKTMSGKDGLVNELLKNTLGEYQGVCSQEVLLEVPGRKGIVNHWADSPVFAQVGTLSF
jgi:hypothetical protein